MTQRSTTKNANGQSCNSIFFIKQIYKSKVSMALSESLIAAIQFISASFPLSFFCKFNLLERFWGLQENWNIVYSTKEMKSSMTAEKSGFYSNLLYSCFCQQNYDGICRAHKVVSNKTKIVCRTHEVFENKTKMVYVGSMNSTLQAHSSREWKNSCKIPEYNLLLVICRTQTAHNKQE